jgi:3-oxoacyl-[acyl-carrier protein] reductase
MDLGLKGKQALVCASSKGLGKACALALASEGALVTLSGRDAGALAATAAEIDAIVAQAQAQAQNLVQNHVQSQVRFAVGDLGTETGRAAVLAACPAPDILITNNGGPPPGDFRNWSREDWVAALDMNMLAPIAMIRATLDGMLQRRWGRIVNITSSAVKSPIEVLGLSNGARAGLTGFVGGLARSVAASGVTINNLLPGPHRTDRMAAVVARMPAPQRPARTGEPQDFGAVCAFLCSAHTGFITGQNWLVDGGAYPGAF